MAQNNPNSTPVGQVTQKWENAYNSFAGIDITAVFNGLEVGTLQAISWNVTRERGPIYTMGHADPVSFARGKRGIAGSLVFITFDRNELLFAMNKTKFWADRDSVSMAGVENAGSGDRNVLPSILKLGLTDISSGDPTQVIQSRIGTSEGNQDHTTFFNNVKKHHSAWYADQLMPFEITLLAANEYGHAMTRKLFGVEILNEGGGVSIDDLVLENQYSFICRNITPWLPAKGADGIVGSQPIGKN